GDRYIKNLVDGETIDIEKSLSSLLKPIGMKFKKFGTSSYAIFSNNSLNSLKENGLNDSLHKFRGEDFTKESSISKQISIKGQVTSLENGESLPGVNILVKGTSIGTVTDINGY